MFTDITARKQAEEEKVLLESQLLQSQKMEAVGTLAGGVAHDFNNILTAIMGFTYVLRMDLKSDDPKIAYVDQILSASQKAASLTQSLLAFSRKQQIDLKLHKMNDIVGQTAGLLKRLLTEDIELKVILSHRNPTILADIIQIDQILMNLTTNARDAMPKGGILRIETGTVTLDEEFIALHGYGEPGEYALLSVSDTGTGMDEKTKEHIFEPFFTTKEVGKGTGLGLSSVYGAVRQHNGYITVDSTLNEGAIFRIYLPLVHRKEKKTSLELSDVQRGSETILVAEDDPAVRMLVTDVLHRYGYTTVEAIDGRDALRKFIESRGHIDLIIIDVVMPKMDGKELYEQIKRKNSNIKVLFTSGYTRDVVIDKGVEDDRVDFIRKPIRPRELLSKVREVLDK
jgi:nitrogen-specific signal transduction histidine kinase